MVRPSIPLLRRDACIALAGGALALGELREPAAQTTTAVPAWPTMPPLPSATVHPALHLVGDSTLADKADDPPNPEYGWGQGLREWMAEPARLLNHGRNGRSTKSFRELGHWDHVLANLAPGDWVLIQFGHNDARADDPARFAGPEAYAENLRRYLRELRDRGALPLLVTPVVRRRFDAKGRLMPSHGPYPEAMRRVARELDVPLLELHDRSAEWLQALGAEASLPAFQHLPPKAWLRHPQGRRDDTHLSLGGARALAALAVAELRRLDVLPAGWLLPAPNQPFARGGFEALGWAHATRGGAGGRILRVSSLAAAGPGSLADALAQRGPRIVVFEVGGTIDMAGAKLLIAEPFVSVAGQTAPSPGITIVRGELLVQTHDVIVQHLRIRPGEWGRPKRGGGDQDGLTTMGAAHEVVVDHCSFSWATDENLSASGPRFDGGATPEHWRRATSRAITFSHNLIYESLSHSVHEKGEHSKGTLIHDNASGVLLLANVYISNRERNALWKGGTRGAMVNNLIFNPGARAAHYNLWREEWGERPAVTGELALVGNWLRHGPDTPAGTPLFMLEGDGDLAIHLLGNRAEDRRGEPVAEALNRSRARLLPATLPLPGDVTVRPIDAVRADLHQAVGARPWDRDALDAQVLAEMAQGRGRIIDSEAENALGGFLRQPVARRAFVETDWDLDRMRPRAGWATLAIAARGVRNP